ncbi:unnamed protein product, partial [Porites lobata]
SDVEDVTPANTDFPSSDVLLPSLPKQPLSQSLEASVPIWSSEPSDIASVFSLFKDYFDKKLGALKRDIQDESCSNTDSVAEKLKEESKNTFRFEGNKKQFQFNSDLAEKMKSASVALGKRKLDLVKTHLEELDSDIKKRNKLIRLADKSAAGWDLVNEYLSDELASGSQDEKRIRRAEQRALRKRNQRQQKAKPSKQANQDQVIFVSPAASKVIGGLSVMLILKPDLQTRGRPFLVLLVFRALEVNRCPIGVPRELNACADAISHIVDFDDCLIQESASCTTIDEVHYGLKWVHDLAGLPDPCNSSLVLPLIESAKRLLSIPVKKKEPVTPEAIQLLFAKYGSSSASLSDLRVLTLCVLGYAGFFRFNELVELRRCDFQFEDSFMRIFVHRSKTDVYRDGAWVVIAKTFKHTCPYLLVQRYFV